MHHFILRSIGHSQEAWQQDAIQQYASRLQPFAKVELIELEEGHGGASKPDERKTKLLESASLLKSIPTNAFVIALDETGKNISSTDFAKKIEDTGTSGQPIVFLIGGSWGLDESVRARASLILSFGKQTLPHVMAKIVLLEQLYRVETILKGKTYHK